MTGLDRSLDHRVLVLEMRQDAQERSLAHHREEQRSTWQELRGLIGDLSTKLGLVLDEMTRETGRVEERARMAARFGWVKQLIPYIVIGAVFFAESWVKGLVLGG